MLWAGVLCSMVASSKKPAGGGGGFGAAPKAPPTLREVANTFKSRLPKDISEEFDNAWSDVISLLKEAGADASHIVEYTSYHVGLRAHMAEFMAVRDKYLSEPWPAWTAIGITELAVPGAHVEIRVTAKLP